MREDSQDVGLEAATIERVRNSSLVECTGTENVARLKSRTEAVELGYREDIRVGRGAFLLPEKPDRKDWWRPKKCECRNE